MDLASILAFGRGAEASRIAINRGGAASTYRELDRDATAVGEALRSAGFRAGHVVAIIVDEESDWPAAVIAVWRLGGVIVPLDPANQDECDDLLGRTSPAWVIGRPVSVEGICGRTIRAMGDKLVAVELAGGRDLGLDSDVAYLVPTSGTTGRPKIVLGSRRGLASYIAAELDLLGAGVPWNGSRLTSPTFDVFWRDVLVPIASRGTLCLLPRLESRVEAATLSAWIDEVGVQVVHCVPTLMRSLGRELGRWSPATLRWLLVAGEPLFGSDVRPWLDTPTTVVNVYGTSETTLAKFFHVVTREDAYHDPIPVGRCIRDAGAIVLDERLDPCPPGKTGEIFIATRHRLHGYLDDEARSRERFVPNPTGGDGALVDRTGDLGRFRADGTLEVLGRVDGIVKAAGVRVDLLAIEGRLRNHPGVRDCHVTLARDVDNEAYVAAFVSHVLRGNARVEFAEWLRETGIAVGVPLRIESVAAIPRTARGKVSTRDLLKYETPEQAAPRTALEHLLHRLWCQILPGTPRLGVEDRFDLLGGQSVHAAQIVARIRHALGVPLSLGEFFARPTIAELAEYLESLTVGSSRAVDETYAGRFDATGTRPLDPLSFAQRRFWRMMSTPGAPTFHYLWLAEVSGPLAIGRLRQALQDVAEHQPATRSIIAGRDPVGEPLLGRAPLEQVVLEEIALDGADRATVLEAFRRFALQPYRHTTDVPLRACVATLGNERHIFGLTGHVIVSDGTSKDLLLEALGDAYEQRPLGRVPHSFGDYAAWERGPAGAKAFTQHLQYWRARLPRTLVPPALPYRGGGGDQSRRAGGVLLRFGSNVREGLAAASRDASVSEVSVVLTAFLLALGEWSGLTLLPVLVPNFNRLYPEEQQIAGCWTETALLNVECSGPAETLQAVGEAIQGFLDHAVPFEWLLDCLYPGVDTYGPELFPIMFAPQPDLTTALHLTGCTVEEIAGTELLGQAIFALHILPTLSATGLDIVVTYDCERFDIATVETLGEALERWIRQLAGIEVGA
jgi:amino acid adenylation domain-containing protein